MRGFWTGILVALSLTAASGLAGAQISDDGFIPEESGYGNRGSYDRGWAGPDSLIARDGSQDQARDGVASGRYVPLDKVLNSIRQRYPGEPIRTEPVGGDGRSPLRYKVIWLTPEGRRLDFWADAETGKVYGPN